MKKKIFFTIIIVLVIAIIFSISFIILKKNKSARFENIRYLDQLSNDELIEFSNSGDKFPSNFIESKVDDYERIINSSNSTNEAKNAVLEEFNSSNMGYTNKVIKNNLILQTDNYYGLDVSWIYTNPSGNSFTYNEKVISFKKSIYDSENNIFYSPDQKTIREILNLIYYMKNYNNAGSKVLQSTISENFGNFEYTIYYIERTFGDWGLNDRLHFLKDIIKIDKSTGNIISTDSVQIKNVEIAETAPYID